MAVSSKIEEIILEISRAAGKIYEANLYGIGDTETPNSAIFEINNLYNNGVYGVPYFGTLETSPLGFQITYDSLNDRYNVTFSSGQVSYNTSIIQVAQQNIPIKKDFSKIYSDTVDGADAYKYGITVGFPLSEAQKAISVWETVISQTIPSNSDTIYIQNLSIVSSLGFPLEAHVGSLYLRFISYNSDKTGILIDPSFKIGATYGKTTTSISVNTPVRFIVNPRLRYVSGYPILSGAQSVSEFNYFPPTPNDWLPIGKILVQNPDNPIVAGTSNDAFQRTVYDYPTNSSDNPILGTSTDVGMVIDSCNSAIYDLNSISSNLSVTNIIQAIRLFTSKQITGTNISFRKFWSLQPFRSTSYYSKGISFSGLEKFQFPYNFVKAYYNTTNEDLQHIFATFRGDLITYNSALMGNNQVNSSTLSSNVISCSNYLSSLDTGTQIYGVSVVSNISLTEYGESIPIYTSKISSDTTNSNYLVELSWSGSGISNPMFYHVYKRPKLASELVERKLTYTSEISYAPYNTLTPITDTTDYKISNQYVAGLIYPNEKFYVGGISFKLGYINPSAVIYNPTDTFKVGIYDSTYLLPDVTKPLTSEETFRYGDLLDGTSNIYTVKFLKGANLEPSTRYWFIITKTTDLLVGTGVTQDMYTRTLPGAAFATFTSDDNSLWTNQNRTLYYKVRGYIDNGSVAGETIRRGVQFTNRVALVPQRLSVYVPPVDSLSYNTGLRFDGSTTGIAATTDTSIKNDLVVSVTARNGENGTPFTFTTTVPKGTQRDTRFLLGTSTDLFDRVDDVSVTPGTNLTRNNNGPVLWDIYDLITVETVP
jgi:hypothetical protein